MEGLMNLMRREAERVAQGVARTRIGLVSSYDPTAYMVKVRLQPEDQETGWLRIMGSGAASGVGVFAPPPIGAQVVVHFQEGSGNSGIVGGTLHSEAQPPAAVPAGEVHIVTAGGGTIRITNGGHDVEVLGTNIKATATTQIVVDCPDVRLGDATASKFVKLADGSNATKVKAI